MDLLLPSVFQIDDLDAKKNPIRQLLDRPRRVRGTLAGFTRERLHGHLFQSDDGAPAILIVPITTKVFDGSHFYVLAAAVNPSSGENDLRNGRWLRHPISAMAAGAGDPLETAIASWKNAFSYTAEDLEHGVQGLRPPQLGAIHAIHAHWATSSSTATIVMPTGTGKTDTMLGILVSGLCARVLVVVPTDPLRSQIAEKFLDLGILRAPGVDVLAAVANYPVVCTLEHIPKSRGEVEEIFSRAHVVVTTSAIVGQCSDEVQKAFPESCPYLFIDEAHHAEAPTWSRFKARFKDRRVVQFTATPFREDGKPLDGRIVFKYPLRKAQEEGYFKPIRFEPIVEFDLRRADRQIAERAVARLREELHLGHILMARVETVARAKTVFEFYKDYADLKPIQLHTGIKSARERDRARQQLIAKESRIVVCVDMLGEGFDLPELKIAAFHDIRKSLAVTLQLAGRFTRSRPDLGNATFIANVADVNVQEELQKLYTRDPDWNVLLPTLSEQLVGEQSALQDFMSNFTDLPAEVPLQAVRPATSTVVYATRCDDWSPDRFKTGIPGADNCERFYHAVNQHDHTLVIVTARKLGLQWTDAENIYDWQWELFVIFWDAERSLLFINSSSNSSDFKELANVLTGQTATLIAGQRVFRVFSGIKRLRLQNVGLTEQIGRNVRYTGRMGSDVESRLTEVTRGNAQKSVIAGAGFENGSLATMGASRKGRIWSHQRERLNQFVEWCRSVGSKLLDQSIDPDTVLAGTLIPELVDRRPQLIPLAIDWPESIYTEPENNWTVMMSGHEYPINSVSINLIEASATTPLRFVVSAEERSVEFELDIFPGEGGPDYRFIRRGDGAASIKHGSRAQPRSLDSFFYSDPPAIWFVDGSSLEGNQYVPLRTAQPPYDLNKIVAWDWTGVNIRSESQGEARSADTVQAAVIRRLLTDASFQVVFDDDGAGEAADVVAIRLVGTLERPERIEVEFYHCKYSHGANPGHRISDLYEVCGQAQKSIWWASTPIKKTDLLTHLMKRESIREVGERATRFERGTVDDLYALREISRQVPVTFGISIVQPGLGKSEVSNDQLLLLGVTQNHLWETYQLPLMVIASA